MPLELAKVHPFTHDVVFIDGFWGSGKSLLAPIMSGMRGIEKQNSRTVTSALRGPFRDDPKTRDEFLRLAHTSSLH